MLIFNLQKSGGSAGWVFLRQKIRVALDCTRFTPKRTSARLSHYYQVNRSIPQVSIRKGQPQWLLSNRQTLLVICSQSLFKFFNSDDSFDFTQLTSENKQIPWGPAPNPFQTSPGRSPNPDTEQLVTVAGGFVQWGAPWGDPIAGRWWRWLTSGRSICCRPTNLKKPTNNAANHLKSTISLYQFISNQILRINLTINKPLLPLLSIITINH